jgi:hypothetical protein
MKGAYLYCTLLLLLSKSTIGQLNENGYFSYNLFNFSSTCAIPSSGTCGTFNSGCVTNWERSHGSPQIKMETVSTPKTYDNYFGFMWSKDAGDGEGMYTSFNFIANRPYRIKINARASLTSGPVGGSMKIFAANGLTPTTTGGCGEPVATPSSSQEITPAGGQSNIPVVWTNYTYTFIPSSNFSQLYIYPLNAVTNEYYYYIDIDAVDVSYDCDAVRIYNSGTLPTGETKAGYITAGSGNSSIVTVVPTSNTDLLATHEVTLVPEINLAVTTGAFTASIYNCQPYILRKTETEYPLPPIPMQHSFDDQVQLTRTAISELTPDIAPFGIYPNPSTGKLYVNIPLVNEQDITISITNTMGVVVKALDKRLLNTKKPGALEINTADLSAGVYILYINGKNARYVKKFVKQ